MLPQTKIFRRCVLPYKVEYDKLVRAVCGSHQQCHPTAEYNG